ncbi:MAG TPA: hypothetical protein VFQ51_06115 [Vicinamibacteria bacterium]|nr:hypothetical protein [Vicinamibacteria bacterium]
MAATAEGTGLGVVLDVPGPAAVGLPIIASLAVVNRGREPRVVSSRLNLIEGDVRLRVTKPDGAVVTISGAGGQPDTAYRQATLPPAHEIRGGMNLQADDASTFAEPGTYVLQADYLPSPREDWVESRPVRLEMVGGTAAQRDAAALLAKDGAGTALALGQEGAADALRALAARHGETPAGRLARLMLAGSAAGGAGGELDRLVADTDPETVAVWLRALSTPFSGTGERLAAELASRLEKGDTAKSAARERAVRIARGLPFRSI